MMQYVAKKLHYYRQYILILLLNLLHCCVIFFWWHNHVNTNVYICAYILYKYPLNKSFKQKKKKDAKCTFPYRSAFQNHRRKKLLSAAADLQFVFERFVNMKQSKAMHACKFEAYYPVEQFNK